MMNNLAWTRLELPSGLRVLTFPRLSGLTTQISIGLEYGSNSDLPDDAGTAHFLEHLVAGGSEKRIQLSRDIERLGGCLDYFTTHDYTMVQADFAPDKVAQTSKILSQILFDSSSFEKEKFERERKIILHEIAEASDNPWVIIEEALAKCLFRTHPVRLPVSGYRKTVSKLSQEKTEQTHLIQYAPRNAILILTGQFNDKDLVTVLQNFQTENSNASTKKTSPTENGPSKKQAIMKKSGISQTYFSIGVKTVSGKHPDIPALELINAVLGAGASSRLFIELREKRALAYNIMSFQESGTDYGYFHIDCATKPGRQSQARNLIEEELAKIQSGQVTEQELIKVKDMIMGAIYREMDSPMNLPETLASLEMQFKKETALEEYIQKIKSITTHNITETANKYLQPDNFSAAILDPKT
jgi:predicted Zn-dependent peptidase